MATPSNRTALQNVDQNLIDGVTKHQSTLPPLIIDGTSYAAVQIIALLQKRIDSGNAVIADKAAYQAAVSTDRTERASTAPFVSGLKQALRVAFATQIATLADFGLKPRKARAPLTTEQKAAAKAKAAATRAARHTMGPKAKSKITGTTVVSTAPAAPAVPAAPVNGGSSHA